MAKKSLADRLKKTTEAQRGDNLKRFELADTALLAGEPKPEPKAKAQPKPKPKPHRIRDNFEILKSEFDSVDDIRREFARAGLLVNKTDVYRMGLRVLLKLKSSEDFPEMQELRNAIKK